MSIDPKTKDLIKETIQETFLALGIDTSSSDGIVKFQQDMHYVRGERLRRENLTNRALQNFFGMVMSAAGAAVILGIAAWAGKI